MDFSQIPSEDTATEDKSYTPPPVLDTVPGRVLHVDADFLAYQHGYRWEEEPLSRSVETLKVKAHTLRIAAGAEIAILYTTRGDKGGRYEIAMVQEYQAQRTEKDPGLKQRVDELRQFMADWDEDPHIQPHTCWEEEADDGLCQAMYAGRDEPNLHVLWSLDKDLLMVGGLHMNDDYEIEEFPWGYGSCELVETKSGKKLVGKGTSFFWHQLLMGDNADNIPGLPRLAKESVLEHLPHPKYYTDAYARKATTNAQRRAKARAIEDAEKRIKSKACGPVAAHAVLAGATTDAEAFKRVRKCYSLHYGTVAELECWDGKIRKLSAGHLLLEQARLLWMRRTVGEDVLGWLVSINS